jgi:hypothetical protein
MLKNYTMMKKLMTLGALSKGKKPEGDSGEKDVTPIPREAAVLAIFEKDASGIPKCWVPRTWVKVCQVEWDVKDCDGRPESIESLET